MSRRSVQVVASIVVVVFFVGIWFTGGDAELFDGLGGAGREVGQGQLAGTVRQCLGTARGGAAEGGGDARGARSRPT